MDQYWNAYSYCGADPVNYVDEWGLSAGDGGPGDFSLSFANVSGDGYTGEGQSNPITPNPSGPGSTIVYNQDRDDGPPTITSSYDNGLKDYNKDGNIDDKDINLWFDKHNLQEEAFKKFVWKLRSDRHYVFAMLIVFGKKSYDIYKTVHGAKSLTKKIGNGAKRGPKTDPNAPHNSKIKSEAEKIEDEGGTIIAGGGNEKEQLIRTPGGKKDGRRPDILYEDANGTKRGRNIGKTKADGSPIQREQDALDDLNNKGGLPTDFVNYD